MSNNKAQLLKNSLMIFYKNKDNLEKFVNVIEKNTDYSLRVIEWFCNNYSKKFDVVYKIDKNTQFNVYLSYKSQLDSYQKKQFDPFKRKHDGFETFPLKYDKNDNFVLTTVGQLNFFKWCICNKVLDYVQKHIKEIKSDMINSVNYITNTKSKKNTPTPRKKRQPLSVSATRVCVKRYTNAVLVFD